MSLKKPITNFTMEEMVEVCKNSDALSDKQKEYLDNEQVLAILEQRKAKVPQVPLLNFIKVISRVINAQIKIETATKVVATVLVVRDRITKKYIESQNEKHLQKKSIYAITDDGQVINFEQWGNKLVDFVIEPFMKGEFLYTVDHWETARASGVNNEIENFTLQQTLSIEQIQTLIESQNLVKGLMDFDESDKYQLAVIKGKINGIYRMKKIWWNPATDKLEARNEFHDLLEESYNPKETDSVPIFRFDINMGEHTVPIYASAEFRKTKLGINYIGLPNFMDLLRKSADSQDTELKQMIYDLYRDSNCYFIGVLRRYNPSQQLADNRIVTTLTLDLGTVIPAPEDDEEVVAGTTAQTILPDVKMPVTGFIQHQHESLSQIITLPDQLKNALTNAVKKEYGEEALTPEVIAFIDTLC